MSLLKRGFQKKFAEEKTTNYFGLMGKVIERTAEKKAASKKQVILEECYLHSIAEGLMVIR